YPVETSLGDSTWLGVWLHQLRWARTIRLTKGPLYVGLPIAHAGLWMVIAMACAAWIPALILAGSRLLSGLLTGWFVLRSPMAAGFCWLTPVWDLYSFAIWLASYTGSEVRWRDQILSIDSQGRIRVC